MPDQTPRGTDDATAAMVAEGHLQAIRRTLAWILVLLAVGAVFFARAVLLPMVLAILLTLVLRPVVRGLDRVRIPPPVGAVLVTVTIALAFVLGAYLVGESLGALLDRAPEISRNVLWKLRGLIGGVLALQELAGTEDGGGTGGIDLAGLFAAAVGSLANVGSAVVAALVLATFLLAAGDLFHRRIVEVSPRLTDKKRALGIVRAVERQVSRYLAAITLINAGMGIVVGAVLWLLGMPYAAVWGVAAFLLNYLPFLGGVIGVTVVGAVALVTFDTVGQAMLAPLAYFLINSVEGQLVTPLIVGRRLALNTAAVFTTVVFWVWLWGVPGALLAVPLLVVIKVIADNVASLNTLGRFLAAE